MNTKQPLLRILGFILFAFQSSVMAVDLVELYQQSVVYDAEYAIAETNLLAEGEQVKRDQAPLLPAIQLSYSKSLNSRQEDVFADQDYEDDLIVYRLTQPLFNVNRWYNFKQAQSSFKEAKKRFDAERQQLIIRVVEAYLNVLRAQENLSATQAEEDFLIQQLDRTNKQLKAGLASITDVHEVRATYDLVKVDHIKDKNNLRISFQVLEVLSGRAYESVQPLQQSVPIELPMPNDLEYWVTQALQNNLSLLSAKYGLEVAQKLLRQAKGNHFPTVNLVARYTDSEGSRLSEEDFTNRSVAIEFNIPLYEGGGTKAQVRQAYYQLEESELTVKLEERTVIQEVRRLFETVAADVSSVQAQQQAIISNRIALKSMREGYRVGRRDIVDVLDAQQALYGAIRDHANAQYDYFLNRLKLYQVAGILRRKHLVELNQLLTP